MLFLVLPEILVTCLRQNTVSLHSVITLFIVSCVGQELINVQIAICKLKWCAHTVDLKDSAECCQLVNFTV